MFPFFPLLKQGYLLAKLNVTLATLLDFSATAQNKIGFPIRVGRFVFYFVRLMKGQYMPSST